MKLQRLAIILAALLLLAGFGIQQYSKQQTAPFTQALAQNIPAGTPGRIIIKSANIDVWVMPGGIVDGKWILSDTFAHTMNKSGNTIIYAHRRPKLFGTLYQTKKGDEIVIVDHHGKTTKYKVTSVEDIQPTDSDKVYAGGQGTLTLFTCDGAFDNSRLMVKAKAI